MPNEEENVFEIVDTQEEPTEKDTRFEIEKPVYVIEALQIIRVKKTALGHSREIIDTIKVVGGEVPYHRAATKAAMIGSCMIVEKLERVYKVFGDAKVPTVRGI